MSSIIVSPILSLYVLYFFLKKSLICTNHSLYLFDLFTHPPTHLPPSGARRLNTVMHRVLEDLSFAAPRMKGTDVVVDGDFVRDRLKDFDLTKEDSLSRYIL